MEKSISVLELRDEYRKGELHKLDKEIAIKNHENIMLRKELCDMNTKFGLVISLAKEAREKYERFIGDIQQQSK